MSMLYASVTHCVGGGWGVGGGGGGPPKNFEKSPHLNLCSMRPPRPCTTWLHAHDVTLLVWCDITLHDAHCCMFHPSRVLLQVPTSLLLSVHSLLVFCLNWSAALTGSQLLVC
jgi:hypothetical protein